jgi:FkbM family methyltransferase
VIRSYAQHAEDVRLVRAFAGRTDGYYVDVGAWHPVLDSVTKYLYDLGWHGIDIEPGVETARLLREDRPRDLVLEVACSDADGEMTLYETDVPNDWSTLEPQTAEAVHAIHARGMGGRVVPVRTLRSICAEHVREQIDFLKIDAEGHEAAVLRGADFDRWRPSVVVVEATVPHTTAPSHGQWESVLLDSRYLCAGFDGINRYYAAEECSELAPQLAAPVTVLDRWETHRYLAALEGEAELRAELERATADLDELRRRYAEAEDALEERRRTSLRVPAAVATSSRRLGRALRRRPRS